VNPISFDSAYEVERNRLTTFFRLIVAIPWLLWLYIYGIGAAVVVFIAWFALLFTGRYPEGMYNFVAGYLRLATRVGAYVSLLTDRFPSFSGSPEPDYPVRIDVGPPQERYNRAKTFFKLVLYFPQMLIAGYGLAYVLLWAAFISWFRIVVTGKQSITMHEALVASTAYLARSNGFILLLTEAHPRTLEVPRYEPPADAPGLPSGTAPAAAAIPPGQAATPPPPPPPPAGGGGEHQR
jgi:hypothetical protein